MGYEIDNANEQYNSFGAETCIRVDENVDLATKDIDNMIEIAREEGATFQDDGDEEVFVVELPGRPQEVYTEDALRRSLEPYIFHSY